MIEESRITSPFRKMRSFFFISTIQNRLETGRLPRTIETAEFLESLSDLLLLGMKHNPELLYTVWTGVKLANPLNEDIPGLLDQVALSVRRSIEEPPCYRGSGR